MRNPFAIIGLTVMGLVAAIPPRPPSLTAQVPTPTDHFGFPMGAAGKLANWDGLTAYCEALAHTSDRVTVDTLGPTTMGRPFVMLTITSPANHARLDDFHRVQHRLADPPFGPTMLAVQEYPDMREYPDGPPKRPYDVTAHALPLLMGVDAAALEAEPEVALSDPIEVPAVEYRLPGALSGPNAPRVGLYKGYDEPMVAGWTRWMFDTHGMPCDSLHDARMRAGSLGDDYDVMIFRSQSDRSISRGNAPGYDGFTAAWYWRSSRAFTVDDERVEVPGRYGEVNPVIAGWIPGPERLAGRPALLRARVGRGEVILFGFQPNHRGRSIVAASVQCGRGGRTGWMKAATCGTLPGEG